MADAAFNLPTNTGGTVHFKDIAQVARFADLNARRVSGSLEALQKCDADESLKLDLFELLTDVAYQVAGAVEILANAVEPRKGSTDHA